MVVMSLLEYYRPNHSNTFSMGKCQEVSLSLSLEIHLTNLIYLNNTTKKLEQLLHLTRN
jgi:hypothetical protein